MKKRAILLVLFLVWAGALAAAPSGNAGRFEFPAEVTAIEFEGVSGDVTLIPAEGATGLVKLRASVRPEGNFRPEVDREGSTLYITEHWKSNSSGSVEWVIYLPKAQKPYRFKMSTASGNLTCKNISAGVNFNTASGNIELSGVTVADGSNFSTASGDIILRDMAVDEGGQFSTASGDVVLENVTIGEDCGFSTASGDVRSTGCKGYFALSSASGDVVVKNCELVGRSKFSTASGNVNMYLDRLPAHNLKASSASGDVVFTCADFGGDFSLVLVAREDGGDISCPFDFTSEDTFEENGEVYDEKIVERGNGRPEISLSTASGEVIVKD